MAVGTKRASPLNPIAWAAAFVILVVFSAVAYRIVTSCEPSKLDLLRHLKVELGGCAPPPGANPTAEAPAATQAASAGRTQLSEVQSLHQIAKRLSFAVDRDRELEKVLALALAYGTLNEAVEIAKELSFSVDRDKAFEQIVEAAISIHNLEAAEAAASQLSFSTDKDRLRSRILEASTAKKR